MEIKFKPGQGDMPLGRLVGARQKDRFAKAMLRRWPKQSVYSVRDDIYTHGINSVDCKWFFCGWVDAHIEPMNVI